MLLKVNMRSDRHHLRSNQLSGPSPITHNTPLEVEIRMKLRTSKCSLHACKTRQTSVVIVMSKRKATENSAVHNRQLQQRPLRPMISAPPSTTYTLQDNPVIHASGAQEAQQSRRKWTIRIVCDQCRTSKVAVSLKLYEVWTV